MKYVNRYNNKYSITEEGKIWSNSTNQFLKTKINKLGYEEIRLGLGRKNKGTHTIHRLVAETYLPNPNNYREVNHKNGIKTDNRLENLEWTTRSENMKHAIRTGLKVLKRDLEHPAAKLSLEQIKQIVPKIDGRYGTLSRIAREYGVSVSLLSLIKRGHRQTT